MLTICDTDSPPAYPVLGNMNFKPNEVKDVISTLNWATADPDHVPRMYSILPYGAYLTSNPVVPPSELPPEEIRSERQKSRLIKRKAMNEVLQATRNELFSGEFDA